LIDTRQDKSTQEYKQLYTTQDNWTNKRN